MNNSKMIKLFLNEVCKNPPLSVADEFALCKEMVQGSTRARDTLILRNMRMVVNICRAYSGQGVPFLDLCIEGGLGLYEATLRFNPDQQFRFTSYAVWWIRQKVVLSLANGQPGYSRPLRFFTDRRELRKAREKGISPNLSEKDIERVEQLSENVVSTEAGESRVVGDFIKTDAPGPDAEAEKTNTRETVATALDGLTVREQTILKLFYGLGGARRHNLREVAEVLCLSKERIRQIKRELLERLRKVGSLRELCPNS